MTSADSGTDPDFDDALAEAVDTLQEAYPEAEISDGRVGLDDLVEGLSESTADAELRRDVARILSMLAEQFPTDLAAVAPAVIDRLDDEVVRSHLLRALGYVSKTEPEAVRPATGTLVALLDADDPDTVRNATWVLSNVVTADRGAAVDAFPEITELLSHDDEEVRRHAARVLASAPESVVAGEDAVLQRLLDLLEQPSLYRTAGRTLVSIAPAYGEQLSAALLDRIEGGRPVVREHAAWTLVPLADEHPDLVRERWPELVDVVRDDDDHQVQNSAAAALAALVSDRPESDLLRALVDLLDHDDMFVRRYGCLALGDVAVAQGNDVALRALAEARDDEAAIVSREAEQLLANAAREHPDVVSEFADDLVDSSNEEP